jgi:DNA-binding NtrC family response regulator
VTKHAILICDDDAEIRAAMRRVLREYAVTEAATPREALDLLRAQPFVALISDFALESDADGLDLLQLVRVQYPKTIRFLVTGNRDLDVVVRAVNEGAVDRYFQKPWDEPKLLAALSVLIASRV